MSGRTKTGFLTTDCEALVSLAASHIPKLASSYPVPLPSEFAQFFFRASLIESLPMTPWQFKMHWNSNVLATMRSTFCYILQRKFPGKLRFFVVILRISAAAQSPREVLRLPPCTVVGFFSQAISRHNPMVLIFCS